MRAKGVLAVVTFSFILASSVVFAAWEDWQGAADGVWVPQYNRMYNTAAVETVSGTIESVDMVTPMKGMNYGVHVMVKTDKETIPVHPGPCWYIERLDTKLEKGDKVEVKGSRVTTAGMPAIIAAEVKKGDNTLVLRDSAGIPVWVG